MAESLKEYQIIIQLQEGTDVTQREIAKNTGLSLGLVNLLLQRMIKKGLVKIEKLNARSLRYILTPKGMAEKVRLTCEYLKNCYAQITGLMEVVTAVIARAWRQGYRGVILYGPGDEVLQILKIALEQQKIEYKFFRSGEEPPFGQFLFIVWTLEDEKKLTPDHHVVNILKVL
ncbi:MAG TPA: winged helix-turn-helix transcriptional regulator [Firmicutes bacterium]|nr:winged helix-turn-helix transcriptional regulator [Bacillota bacterium]